MNLPQDPQPYCIYKFKPFSIPRTKYPVENSLSPVPSSHLQLPQPLITESKNGIQLNLLHIAHSQFPTDHFSAVPAIVRASPHPTQAILNPSTSPHHHHFSNRQNPQAISFFLSVAHRNFALLTYPAMLDSGSNAIRRKERCCDGLEISEM